MFSRGVMMSGSLYPPYPTNHDASEDFVRLLTCDSVDERIMLKCLQQKSLDELQKAYESIVRNENRSNRYFGPTVDSFIDDIDARNLLNFPFNLITEFNYTIDVPILIGIVSNEGAFVDGKIINDRDFRNDFRLKDKLDLNCRYVNELWKTRIPKVEKLH
jgi:carboxylesterase type B